MPRPTSDGFLNIEVVEEILNASLPSDIPSHAVHHLTPYNYQLNPVLTHSPTSAVNGFQSRTSAEITTVRLADISMDLSTSVWSPAPSSSRHAPRVRIRCSTPYGTGTTVHIPRSAGRARLAQPAPATRVLRSGSIQKTTRPASAVVCNLTGQKRKRKMIEHEEDNGASVEDNDEDISGDYTPSSDETNQRRFRKRPTKRRRTTTVTQNSNARRRPISSQTYKQRTLCQRGCLEDFGRPSDELRHRQESRTCYDWYLETYGKEPGDFPPPRRLACSYCGEILGRQDSLRRHVKKSKHRPGRFFQEQS